MTIDQMEALLRVYLNNPSTNSLSSANAFLLINAAYKSLYNRIVKNNENFFVTRTSYSLVASTELYTLTAFGRVVLVERVDLTQEFIVPFIPYSQRTRYLVPSGQTVDGYDSKVYLLGGQFGIVPVATAASANAIRVTTATPAVSLTTGQSPPTTWTDDHHEVIVLEALLKAGIRDREERALRIRERDEALENLITFTSIRQAQEPKAFEQPEEEGYQY